MSTEPSTPPGKRWHSHAQKSRFLPGDRRPVDFLPGSPRYQDFRHHRPASRSRHRRLRGKRPKLTPQSQAADRSIRKFTSHTRLPHASERRQRGEARRFRQNWRPPPHASARHGYKRRSKLHTTRHFARQRCSRGPLAHAGVRAASLRPSQDCTISQTVNRPDWSASIDANRGGQNMLARETVRRFLERAPQHEIDRAAYEFLGFARHFQKLGCRDR